MKELSIKNIEYKIRRGFRASIGRKGAGKVASITKEELRKKKEKSLSALTKAYNGYLEKQ